MLTSQKCALLVVFHREEFIRKAQFEPTLQAATSMCTFYSGSVHSRMVQTSCSVMNRTNIHVFFLSYLRQENIPFGLWFFVFSAPVISEIGLWGQKRAAVYVFAQMWNLANLCQSSSMCVCVGRGGLHVSWEPDTNTNSQKSGGKHTQPQPAAETHTHTHTHSHFFWNASPKL